MAKGICVFAEHYNGKLEPVTAELISAAKKISETTGEAISGILVAKDAKEIAEEVAVLGVDQVYMVNTDRDMLLMDDAVSQIIADMLKEIDPSSVIVPATPTGRSLFSRVAMKLNCGMTADCTELLVGTKENGSHYIKQNKPSFGENVYVTIITKEGYYPQMMTVRPGIYEAAECTDATTEMITMDMEIPESKIEVVEIAPAKNDTDSILASEIVVVGGRGAAEGDNFELVKAFAEKIGAAIGGTRPMVDSELIPFNHQIGQTGFTIRPKICVSLGVSGAIQHTEGIKDTKLFVAINQDENAAIYGVADYGMVADLKDVLESYLKL